MTFRMPITPRYMEVDAQGVVFNGWYLTWFDEAMAAYLAHRGLPYKKLIEAGFDVHVAHSELDYKAGVRWGDQVEVAVSTGRIGNTSFALDFQVLRGDEVCTTGRNVYVVVAADFSGKRPIPPVLAEALGEPAPLLPG
ncbi:acyl-CoA thioester hydrolase [Pseudonocardia thermophila]|jgi:Predicted thioesterase|uniref:Acyl-CoA thioester hydrolase n=1 Tax=Pseudonocardia thermophila TaxID=1848 RepID=A0A1M6YIC0_PSETH|nr:thioesterase family protein [Pseudonocardia thermophila]SHL18094.1 acyl-CoA thioester hydrolase [Pseudonocardia thermophila]